MLDAFVPGQDQSGGQFRHYLAHHLRYGTVDDNSVTLDNSSAIVVQAYVGPAPAPGSGPQ